MVKTPSSSPSFSILVYFTSILEDKPTCHAGFFSPSVAWDYIARTYPQVGADIARDCVRQGTDEADPVYNYILDVMWGRNALRSERFGTFEEAYARMVELCPDNFKVLREAPKRVNGSAILEGEGGDEDTSRFRTKTQA